MLQTLTVLSHEPENRSSAGLGLFDEAGGVQRASEVTGPVWPL